MDYYDNGFVKPPMDPIGTLLLVGGAEDTSAQGIIPKKILLLAGKSSEDIRVLILTSASTKPLDDAYINKWQMAFAQHGANPSHITVLHPESRDEYDALANAHILAGHDIVYFTGGSQETLLERMGNTRFHEQLYDYYAQGGIVGGSSAGCSALSSVMIVRGYSEDAFGYYEKGVVDFDAGLGLTNIIADQHFSKRDRLPRLIVSLMRNYDEHAPLSHVAIGVDEDTMAILHRGHIIEVAGAHSVTVLQGVREDKLQSNRQRYDNAAQGELLLDIQPDINRSHAQVKLWNRQGFDVQDGRLLSPQALQEWLNQVQHHGIKSQNSR